MILDSTSKVLRIVLGENHTTNQCQCVASWAEGAAPSVFTPGNTNILTNDTTPVIVVGAPSKAGYSRDVREVRVFNNDTITHTVTLQLFDGSATWIIAPAKVSVPANGAFVYTPAAGVSVVQSAATGLTVTDGTNTVANTTNLTFAGATVSGTTPNATATIALLQNYLTGLNITIASTTSFTVAAGQAMSGDNTTLMALGSGLTKLSGGTWVAGNNQNGLDTGTIGVAWYHVFLIFNPTTLVTDVLFSLSPSSPSLPSGFTKFRRIGSLLTDGASHFIAYAQNGNRFDWLVPLAFLASHVTGDTLAHTATPTVPTGVVVEAIISGLMSDSAATNASLYISSLAQTNEAAGTGTFITAITPSTAGTFAAWDGLRIETDTAASIRYRGSTATLTLFMNATGWIDRRGQS